MKVNKAGAGDTASLLYQTGFSGRAEMGLAGSDDFALKVSADGATWVDALRTQAATGVVALPQGARIDGGVTGTAVTQGPADATPGRVIRTQDGYVRGTVVGPVGQAAGVPTGAILERGGSADGEYVRYADGTQVCTSPALSAGGVTNATGALFRSALVTWTYALPFAAAPAVSGSAGGSGRWLTVGAASTTGAAFRMLGAVSSATATEARLTAVGRWY